MSSNFSFLQNHHPAIYENALKAEKNVYTDVIASAMFSRRALEYIIYDLLTNEGLQVPYNTSISNLIKELEYHQVLPQSLLNHIHTVRRTGNIASHKSNKRLTQYDAQMALESLFMTCYYLVRTYESNPPQIPAFDKELLQYETEAERTKKELEALQQQLLAAQQEQEQELQALRKQLIRSETEREQYQQEAEEYKTRRIERSAKGNNLPAPIRSEAETRTHLIDLLLAEAGWAPLENGKDKEFKVTGIPSTKSGNGYVDYVLWGNDGKPLALIEAKKASKSPEIGQHQAKEYADALERQFGNGQLFSTQMGTKVLFGMIPFIHHVK